MIDALTTVCCIIGDPVEHSLSPAMHNAAYAELGMNWVYTAFRVTDVGAAVAGIRALGIRGSSVTIPHKLAVIEHLDELDPVAQWIGSVNTIVNDGGKLKGLNTDGPGAVKALRDGGAKLPGAKVLMIGSGGAARAIAFSLAAEKEVERIDFIGVIEAELEKLSGEVMDQTGVTTSWSMSGEEKLAALVPAADLVIHCSPVGMHPHEDASAVPAALWRKSQTVMDIVYNPRETRLLRESRAAGGRIVYGFEMLLNQGVLQFEAWTGKPAPEQVMRKALEDWLAR